MAQLEHLAGVIGVFAPRVVAFTRLSTSEFFGLGNTLQMNPEEAQPMQRQRLIIGVTGSSAPQLGWATLQALHHPDIETHLVVSRGADKTIQLEMG
ncbi:flavoprotein [Mycobacterium sp.]|uniref:flavoprotein n=1 Tax=Mycobacterium sp. TaxID=1785 RepID=UPI002D0460E5|nr:flavoprotein [Mycobacterium sp.]HTQ20888.1 flavoprotein [Mycobacterium sp.]